MAPLQLLRRIALHMVAPLIGGLLLVYFGYHAVQGDRGLFAYLRLERELQKAQLTHELIKAERDLYERRVGLMQRAALDPDMVDERARVMLNLAQKDEVVVMLQRALPGALTLQRP
ncbi:MAG: septum formation initiator family protein [Alphaproteobacteria bacterium]|nr:septum formation initiator family protein [Alphaproteobacteria bacterium]TAD89469.1 MAG: septum formation initiator family protein [Alphaproteobacteria bacterium]